MSILNSSSNLGINRGFEIILRRRKPRKKIFLICFEKIISLFSKEITVFFKFSLDIKNQSSSGESKC